jgi:hypothetical protein
VRRQPREYSGGQVVDEGDEIGDVALDECQADSLVQLLLGEPALDEG